MTKLLLFDIIILGNRNRTFKDVSSLQCNIDNKYDIVAGAVADDDMAMLFRQYQNELIDFDSLVKGMILKKLITNIHFILNVQSIY